MQILGHPPKLLNASLGCHNLFKQLWFWIVKGWKKKVYGIKVSLTPKLSHFLASVDAPCTDSFFAFWQITFIRLYKRLADKNLTRVRVQPTWASPEYCHIACSYIHTGGICGAVLVWTRALHGPVLISPVRPGPIVWKKGEG